MSIRSVREGSSPADQEELRHWAECLEMSCPSSVGGEEIPPTQLTSVQRVGTCRDLRSESERQTPVPAFPVNC